MTELYCRRKNNEEQVIYDIPGIEHILNPTYGVMLYQEQLMFIARDLADFDLVEVDELRKAAAKKNQQLMSDVGKKFIDRATQKGIVNREQAETLFNNMRKSGRYLFCKAHAVAYSINGYRSAHWKCHFPVNFFTSYLRMADDKPKPFDEIRQLINEAKSFDIDVRVPRFTDLKPTFYNDGRTIYFGLTNIKGVSQKTLDKIKLNVESVPSDWYTFLITAANKVGVSTTKSLCEVGALPYELSRQRMIYELEIWVRLTAKEQETILSLPDPILSIDGDEVDPARPVDNLADAISNLLERVVGYTKSKPPKVKHGYSERRRETLESLLKMLKYPSSDLSDTPTWVAKKEEENLGVPITFFSSEGKARSIVDTTVKEFTQGKNAKAFTLGVTVQEVKSRTVQNGANKGSQMATITVVDESGVLEGILLFPQTYEEFGSLVLRSGSRVALTGQRSFRDKDSFIVQKVELL